MGFQDTSQLAAGMRMFNTYDPMRNPLAVQEEDKLPAALTFSIAGESPMDQQEIIASYRHTIGQPRRIDFLFSMSFMSKACLMQDLLGVQMPDGSAGSDHYDVLNTYSYQRMPC